MRKVIRRHIRRSKDGINLAADIDAVISVNTGADAGQSRTSVRSSHSVVQGDAGDRNQPKRSPDDQSGPRQEER